MRIILLISGDLGYYILKEILSTTKVIAVFTDSNSDKIISLCESMLIPLYKGNPRNAHALEFIKGFNYQLLLSVNYLFIVDKEIIQTAKTLSVNIHGSLLPKYRGRTPHIWSIINGELETGVTAHVLNEELDGGDIIKQVVLPIEKTDTGFSLLQKYRKVYQEIVFYLIENIQNLDFYPQDRSKATYFSKRTPEEGMICWDWQKERIHNWIRALSKPYPGAFSFYNTNKVIINKSQFNDAGFSDTWPNGLILEKSEDSIIVKTSNGALKLFDIDHFDAHNFSTNSVLE